MSPTRSSRDRSCRDRPDRHAGGTRTDRDRPRGAASESRARSLRGRDLPTVAARPGPARSPRHRRHRPDASRGRGRHAGRRGVRAIGSASATRRAAPAITSSASTCRAARATASACRRRDASVTRPTASSRHRDRRACSSPSTRRSTESDPMIGSTSSPERGPTPDRPSVSLLDAQRERTRARRRLRLDQGAPPPLVSTACRCGAGSRCAAIRSGGSPSSTCTRSRRFMTRCGRCARSRRSSNASGRSACVSSRAAHAAHRGAGRGARGIRCATAASRGGRGADHDWIVLPRLDARAMRLAAARADVASARRRPVRPAPARDRGVRAHRLLASRTAPTAAPSRTSARAARARSAGRGRPTSATSASGRAPTSARGDGGIRSSARRRRRRSCRSNARASRRDARLADRSSRLRHDARRSLWASAAICARTPSIRGYDCWPLVPQQLRGIALLQFPWSARAMDEAARGARRASAATSPSPTPKPAAGAAPPLECAPARRAARGPATRLHLPPLAELPARGRRDAADPGNPPIAASRFRSRRCCSTSTRRRHLATAGRFPPARWRSPAARGSTIWSRLGARARRRRPRARPARRRAPEPSRRWSLFAAKEREARP